MAAMSTARSRQWLAYSLAFVCFFQTNVMAPVLPRYAAEQLGLSLAAVGFVLASKSIVPTFFAAAMGEWETRIGIRRSLVGAALVTTLAGLLYLVAGSYVMLLLAQVLGGIFYMAVWIGTQNYATRLPDRGRVLGVFSTFTALGQAAAPVVGGYAFDQGGYRATFFAYILASLLLVLLALMLDEPAASSPSKAGASRPARFTEIVSRPGIQTAFLFSFICLFLINTRASFVPVYLQQLGLSGSVTGLILAAGSVGQAVLRPFTKELIRTFGLTGLLVMAGLAGIAGLHLIPLTGTTAVIAGMVFLHGIGVGLHQPIGLMMVADHTTAAERGYAVGLRGTVNQIASTAAPFLVGAAAQAWGIRNSFFLMGGLLLLITLAMPGVARRAQMAPAEAELAAGHDD
jgi:MFS family permease